MPNTSPMITPEQVGELLKGVAHPTRLRIIHLLSQHRKLKSGAIQKQISSSKSLVAYNLTKLTDQGILTRVSRGTKIYYSLADPMLADWISLVLKIWG